MRFAMVSLVVLVMTVACSAQNYILTLTSPSSGEWQAWISVMDCVGLAGFGLDVWGTNGTAVTSSALKAPRYYNPDLGDYAGFTDFRSNGIAGMGITAAQPTSYTGGSDPIMDAFVIQGIGVTAGSGGGVSWGAPALLAEGAYTGTFGDLHLAANSSAVNVLLYSPPDWDQWAGPGWVVPCPAYHPVLCMGDANGDGVVNFKDYIVLEANFGKTDISYAGGDLDGDRAVTFKDYVILEANFGRSAVPEPASMIAFAALLPLALKRVKNRH